MEVEELKAKVSEFFGDTSRSPSETREGLEEVVGHIELLIESLPSDE